jgi:large subunit ribosomal protein L4
VVVEDFSFEAPKTKTYTQMLRSLSLDTKKTLLLTAEYEPQVYLSSRNLQTASVCRAADVNTYDIINAGTLILSEGAVQKLKEIIA